MVHRQKRAWLFGQWIPEGGNGGGGASSNYGSGAAGGSEINFENLSIFLIVTSQQSFIAPLSSESEFIRGRQ